MLARGPAIGHAGRGGGDGAPGAPVVSQLAHVEREGGGLGLPIVPVAEECHVPAVLVQGQGRVFPLTGQERGAGPRRRLHRVGAVGRAILARRGVGQPAAVLAEGVGGHVLEAELFAGLQVSEHEGRPLVLLPVVLLLFLLFRLGPGLGGGLFSGLLGGRRVGLLLGLLQEVGHPSRALLRQLDGPDPGDPHDPEVTASPVLQPSEIQDAQGVVGKVVSPLSLAPERVHDGVDRIDGEHDEPRVGADLRIGASRHRGRRAPTQVP